MRYLPISSSSVGHPLPPEPHKARKREGTCPATINHQIAAQRALGESPRPSSFPFVAHDVIQDASAVSLSFDRRPGAVDGVSVAKRRRLVRINGLVPLSDPTRHDRSPQFAPFPRRFDREAMVKITTSECSHRPNRTRETRRPEWSPRLAVAVTSEPMSPSAAPRKWLPPPSLRPDR